MNEIQNKKQCSRENTKLFFNTISKEDLFNSTKDLEKQLFTFANFLEANIVLLYIASKNEVPTNSIIKRTLSYGKTLILPSYHKNNHKVTLMKIDNLDKNLSKGPRKILQPRENICKRVPIECIDIAIIPGIAMDEKGGRIGSGEGYYDRLIPQLPATTRKVGLIFEEQIIPTIPMEAHDKHIDIIITNQRVIYKI